MRHILRRLLRHLKTQQMEKSRASKPGLSGGGGASVAKETENHVQWMGWCSSAVLTRDSAARVASSREVLSGLGGAVFSRSDASLSARAGCVDV